MVYDKGGRKRRGGRRACISAYVHVDINGKRIFGKK